MTENKERNLKKLKFKKSIINLKELNNRACKGSPKGILKFSI